MTTSNATVDPRGLLEGIHPDLVKVILAAAQKPSPFKWEVTYGVRTLSAEQAAMAAGHSKTLHSRHLRDMKEHGYACAIDITCWENGQAVEVGPRVEPVYTAVAALIIEAAKELNIPFQWGGQKVGAWTPGVVSHWQDWGHFQLPWEQYP